MSKTITEKEKHEMISPEEEHKIPLSLKLVSFLLRCLDSWCYRKDGTANRKLLSYVELKVRASSKPVNGVSTEDVVIDAPNNVWARIFTPNSQDKAKAGDGNSDDSVKKHPVIVFYHGGGFVGLGANLIQYDKFCRTISRSCNAVVVSSDYRLAPEYPYPAAYEDCYKVLEWLRLAESRGDHVLATADFSQCFLMGDSAGGNIAHFMGCRAAESDISPLKIRGMVLLQPFFGGEELTPAEININPPLLPLETCRWAWRAFLPQGADRDHHACNVFGPNSPDISGLSLPPILVLIGSLDILKDWQDRYVQKLEELGKDVKALRYAGGFHAFYIIEVNKLSAMAMAEVYEFIRSHTT